VGSAIHDELVERLRYFDGHSDTLGLFADPGFFKRAAAGGCRAVSRRTRGQGRGDRGPRLRPRDRRRAELGAGFVAIRKPGSVHPGPKLELAAPPDWRGLESVLRLQRHVIQPTDRVLVVDDWAETGSKALTARRLIECCGGRYAGLSLLVDQLTQDARDALEPVAAVAFASELRG
jgi:adenine phosphoribosyltransferase